LTNQNDYRRCHVNLSIYKIQSASRIGSLYLSRLAVQVQYYYKRVCVIFFFSPICCSYIHNSYSLNVQMQTLEFPLRSKIITPQPSLKWAVLFRQHSTIQHQELFAVNYKEKAALNKSCVESFLLKDSSTLRQILRVRQAVNPSSATGCM